MPQAVRKLIWFVVLWGAGVLTVLAVGGIIRWALAVS